MMPEDCYKHHWISSLGGEPKKPRLSKKNLRRYVSHQRWMKAMHTVTALRRMGHKFSEETTEDHEFTRTKSNMEFSVVEKSFCPKFTHSKSTNEMDDMECSDKMSNLYPLLEAENLYGDMESIGARRNSTITQSTPLGGNTDAQEVTPLPNTHPEIMLNPVPKIEFTQTSGSIGAKTKSTRFDTQSFRWDSMEDIQSLGWENVEEKEERVLHVPPPSSFYIDTENPMPQVAPEKSNADAKASAVSDKTEKSRKEGSNCQTNNKMSTMVDLKPPQPPARPLDSTVKPKPATHMDKKPTPTKPPQRAPILPNKDSSTTPAEPNLTCRRPSVMARLTRTYWSNNLELQKSGPRTLVDQLLGQFKGIQNFSFTELRTTKVREKANKVLNKPIIQFRRGMPVNAGVVVEIARRFV